MKNNLMNSIEVYKTDVKNPRLASEILSEIHQNIPGCDASFDLDDCDKVLRIEYTNGQKATSAIKQIINRHGNKLSPLPL